MVNYCCVNGCGRNNHSSKHLFFYSLPKDNPRQEQWLRAIGREEYVGSSLKKSYRVCSRHFSPTCIKNKHLRPDAVPTLFLPGSDCDALDQAEVKQKVHSEVLCDSCKKPILGFRYKCITCPDYDLCSKCEMFEAHVEHYMLRVPKPVNFKVADNLIKKWQKLVKDEDIYSQSHHTSQGDASSDDDIPINRFSKSYTPSDSIIDIPEDIKSKIRDEVTRVLEIQHNTPPTLKRKKESKKKDLKKNKVNEEVGFSSEGMEAMSSMVPEVAFADVNDITGSHILNIKDETPSAVIEVPPMTNLNLTEVDFMLDVNSTKTIGLF